MSIQHLLEDFAPIATTDPAVNSDTSETKLLESFEQGYAAGWDDAIRAKAEERASVSADLARNLQALSFTHHEARSAVLADLSSVLEQIVMKTMPTLIRETLGLQIVDQLTDLARNEPAQTAEIRVSPEDVEVVLSLLPEPPGLSVDVISDDRIAGGQVQIQLGQRERQIDVSDVVQGLSKALDGFVHQSRKEVVYG